MLHVAPSRFCNVTVSTKAYSSEKKRIVHAVVSNADTVEWYSIGTMRKQREIAARAHNTTPVTSAKLHCTETTTLSSPITLDRPSCKPWDRCSFRDTKRSRRRYGAGWPNRLDGPLLLARKRSTMIRSLTRPS